jgi:hypothetical protein
LTEIPERPVTEGEEPELNFVVAARVEVNKLIRANRVNRRWIAALVVLALIMAGVIYGLHQSDVESCQSGNSFRSGQTQIWNHFIGLLINRSTPPATVRVANGYLRYVAATDKLRDCSDVLP